MIHKVRLPKIDANITEATLGAWHVGEGDIVDAGDVLCDVITDKANFELTAEVSGTLRKIIAPEKSQVPLEYVLAIVGNASDEVPDVSADNAALMEAYRASVIGRTVAAPTVENAPHAPAEARERVRATPRARRIAREHGVDLAEVQEAARVDRVTEKDVEDYLKERSS